VSCAKTAEPIEMLFESSGSREHMLHGDVDASTARALLRGVSSQVKSIVKHRIWGLSKRVSCAENW